MSVTYFTHFYGSRPFRVDSCGTEIKVFKLLQNDTYQLCRTYCPIKTFFPKSNSGTVFAILIHLGNLSYVFIGHHIKEFKTSREIQKFVSDVPDDRKTYDRETFVRVPYSYAVDSDEKFYFFVYDVVAKRIPKQYHGDPYKWYRKNKEMTPTPNYMISYTLSETEIRKWERTNIVDLYVGEDRFNFEYVSDPEEEYDWYMSNIEEKCMYIVTKESYPNKILLSRENYVKLVQAFGKNHGFDKF